MAEGANIMDIMLPILTFLACVTMSFVVLAILVRVFVFTFVFVKLLIEEWDNPF